MEEGTVLYKIVEKLYEQNYGKQMLVLGGVIKMRKEIIDDFLSDNKEIKQKIKIISEKYNMSDFVKVTEDARDYLRKVDTASVDGVYGCICNIRKGYMRLDMESVERRLTNEYLDYLIEIIQLDEEIDKVFYIVAYHYLTLTKQMGYQLTGDNNLEAPFIFLGNEMSSRGKRNYSKLGEIYDGSLSGIIDYVTEDDIKYYNKVYREFGYTHHATKHFSLIEDLLGFVKMIGMYKFDYEFEKVLNLFIFEYRAIYTGEMLHLYTSRDKKDKILSNLLDL